MMVDHKAKKMFCENIGLLFNIGLLVNVQNFNCCFLVFDDNFLTAEPLVTKLGMVIHHH